MRRWPADHKQSLRFLASARFYLPQHLDVQEHLENEYRDSLYYQDFILALDILERMGESQGRHADEIPFWKELYFAARHLQLHDHMQKFEEKLQEIADMSAISDPVK